MDTRRDIVPFLAAQTAKGRSFYAAFARSLFLNNINPRKPAPGPDYGIIAKHPANLGNRLWWQQLKSARHGGAKRFTSLRWMPGEWREDDPGNPVWLEPQFVSSTTATSILPAFRPPSRHKARNLDHFRLICHAEGFVEAVKRGINNGCI